MKLKIFIIIIILFVLLSDVPASLSYWIWTPQTKRWINPKYAPKDTPKEQLIYALDIFEAKDYNRALDEFKKVVSYFKRSEAAAEAQYYIGRCHEELGNPYQAYEAYQATMDNYPFSQRTDEIIKREYNIAEKLFQGEKVKLVGLRVNAVPEQIIEIYKKVVKNAPYGEFAPTAQYRMGELYKRLHFYPEALEAFQKVVTDYPDTKIAKDAEFQVAICASAGSSGSAYDQELTTKAIEKFEEFAEKHPDSELVKEAQKEKADLTEKKANSIFKVAKFYEKRGKYKSAIIYYEDIVNNFSITKAAPLAMERIQILKRKVKD